MDPGGKRHNIDERSLTWIKQTLSASGVPIYLGSELYRLFVAAGLSRKAAAEGRELGS
jgi:hypothetical protein